MISSADWMCSRPVRPASIAVVRQHRPDQPGLLGRGDCEAVRRAERGHLAATGWAATTWLFEVSEGESPLTYMPAIIAEFVLGGGR
jgi:hypothetical protein